MVACVTARSNVTSFFFVIINVDTHEPYTKCKNIYVAVLFTLFSKLGLEAFKMGSYVKNYANLSIILGHRC